MCSRCLFFFFFFATARSFRTTIWLFLCINAETTVRMKLSVFFILALIFFLHTSMNGRRGYSSWFTFVWASIECLRKKCFFIFIRLFDFCCGDWFIEREDKIERWKDFSRMKWNLIFANFMKNYFDNFKKKFIYISSWLSNTVFQVQFMSNEFLDLQFFEKWTMSHMELTSQPFKI